MPIGSRIKRLREKEGIQQKDFAKKIGVSNVVLSRYESDERKPDYDTLQKIADFFDVSIDYLLGRTDTSAKVENSDEAQFQKWAKDSETGAFFSEILESEEAEIEELREIWEIMKKRRDKNKGDA